MPEGTADSLFSELHQWIAYERDAAWTAKLAILRLVRVDDIAQLGRFLREHERHADELVQLLRAAGGRSEAPREPCFVTREPHAVGALAEAEAVLGSMFNIEAGRVSRYERRERAIDDDAHRTLDALLERHALDARDRLAWLRHRRTARTAHSLARGEAA